MLLLKKSSDERIFVSQFRFTGPRGAEALVPGSAL